MSEESIKKMAGSGIAIVDDEVFYTLLDEIFPDDDDLFESAGDNYQAHGNRVVGVKSGARKTKAG